MSGHSKWSTIKRKKGEADAKKGKIFTKIGRALAVAIKEAGSDVATNSKLRDVIVKAKLNNVPSDNIQRMIKKASGDLKESDFVEVVYEGYGPGGVAIIVEALTDNRNRTVGDLRHYFDKFGGSLGQTGSVNFMFERKWVVILERFNDNINEETLMLDAIEGGADKFEVLDDCFQLVTQVENHTSLIDTLESKNYTLISSQIEYLPVSYVELADEEHVKNINLLIEHLEGNDDVQEVFHNWSGE